MNDIVKYGLLGLAGYWVYTTFMSSTAATATTTTGTTTGTTTSVPASLPALQIVSFSPQTLIAGQSQQVSMVITGAIAPSFALNGAAVNFTGTPNPVATSPSTFLLTLQPGQVGQATITVTDSGRSAIATPPVIAQRAPAAIPINRPVINGGTMGTSGTLALLRSMQQQPALSGLSGGLGAVRQITMPIVGRRVPSGILINAGGKQFLFRKRGA